MELGRRAENVNDEEKEKAAFLRALRLHPLPSLQTSSLLSSKEEVGLCGERVGIDVHILTFLRSLGWAGSLGSHENWTTPKRFFNSSPVYFIQIKAFMGLKVIPLFCIAHPWLHIIYGVIGARSCTHALKNMADLPRYWALSVEK